MVKIGTPVLTAVFCLLAWSVAGFLAPVAAQSLPKPFPKEKEIDVAPALLAAILADASGRSIIDRFLRGDKPPPEVITRRAAALIRKLGTQRSKLQPEDLLNAVDRIVHVAARSLSYATVMRMAVAKNYRPENGVIAWDFGTPFSRVMPGFERILPNDKRITGADLTAHGVEHDNPLLTDGISGLRKIELDIDDGTYRIILMTQNMGDGTLTKLPFGGEIRIDGVTSIVKGKGPANWQENAFLIQSGLRSAGGPSIGLVDISRGIWATM